MKNKNLIAISGKINSGKDTVGKIIQALTDETISEREVVELAEGDLINPNPTYQIKKFADKLKDCVCLLIGCTREQLEDPKFKNKELGEKWWYYDFKNSQNSGKNKFYHSLIDLQKNEFNSWSDETIKEYTTLVKLTPRKILQLLGTECGREIIHPQIWVNALFADYKGTILPTHSGKITDENCYLHTKCDVCKNQFYGYKRQFRCKKCTDKLNPVYPNWIITDLRFPNELEAVKSRNGITIRVERPCSDCGAYNNIACNTCGANNAHESEHALDTAEFDYVIDNNSSISSLIGKVQAILEMEKII